MDRSCHSYINVNDVEEIIRNAELRTELEPFYDEAIDRVDIQSWTLHNENEFLASMLDWERAPLLPIQDWFDPPLDLPPMEKLSDNDLSSVLNETLSRLYSQGIVLDYCDHLNDRELYDIIVHQILPLQEKKIDNPTIFHHWNCCNRDDENNFQIWLAYYASDEEREEWSDMSDQPLPPKLVPLYSRGFSHPE